MEESDAVLAWSIFDAFKCLEIKEETQEICCSNENCSGKEKDFVRDNDEFICSLCGTVNERIISVNQDYESEQNRDVMSTLISEKSQLTTSISSTRFKKCSKNLGKFNSFNRYAYKDKVLMTNYAVIEKLCAIFHLSEAVVYSSKKLYQMCYGHQINRGKVKVGVICACVYIVSKNYNFNGVSVALLAQESNISKKFVNDGIKTVEKLMFNTDYLKNLMVEDVSENQFQGHMFSIASSLEIQGDDLKKLMKFAYDSPDVDMQLDQLAAGIVAIYTEKNMPDLFDKGKIRKTLAEHIEVTPGTLNAKIKKLKESYANML